MIAARSACLAGLAALALACASDPECSVGQTEACTCADGAAGSDGSEGLRTCRSDGVFGLCDCRALGVRDAGIADAPAADGPRLDLGDAGEAPDFGEGSDAAPADGSIGDGGSDAGALDAGPAPECALSVALSALDFGAVELGRRLVRAVEIRAGSQQRCLINGLTVQGSADFTSTATLSTLEAGARATISVVYLPSAHSATAATLEVRSDDPRSPLQTVQLTGQSTPVSVRAHPTHLDLGPTPLGCASNDRQITVWNVTDATIDITSIALGAGTSTVFELAASTTGSLPPNDPAPFSVRFRPTRSGPAHGTVVVEHSEPGSPLVVALSARGIAGPGHAEMFTHAAHRAVDLLMVIDDSTSMAPEHASLEASIGALTSFADARGIDYHIGITTTDVVSTMPTGPYLGGKRGALVEVQGTSVVTPATPNGDMVLASMVGALGNLGAVDERGLAAAALALSDPHLTGANAAFRRNGTPLSIFVVSDEDDVSLRTFEFHRSFFVDLVEDRSSDLSAVAMVLLPQDPIFCAGAGTDPGLAYIMLAQQLGGELDSVCTGNWTSAVARLSELAFGLRREVFLAAEPNAPTFEVRIDGQLIPEAGAMDPNWVLDAPGRRLQLSEDVLPGGGEQIDLRYDVVCR